MAVPILDAAYMARRNRAIEWQERLAAYTRGVSDRTPFRDTAGALLASAQEQYVEGEIDVEVLEARVEYALRKRPQ